MVITAAVGGTADSDGPLLDLDCDELAGRSASAGGFTWEPLSCSPVRLADVACAADDFFWVEAEDAPVDFVCAVARLSETEISSAIPELLLKNKVPPK